MFETQYQKTAVSIKLYAEIEDRCENSNEQYYKLDGTLLTKQDEIDWLDKEAEG